MDMAAFRSRIDTTPGRGPNGDCHMWLGHKRRKGYGDFRRKLATHIVLEEAGFVRPSKEHGALHSCDNPSCVNLAHLRWGTAKMNAEDVAARRRHRETKKTHCKRGHEFTPENTARRTHKGVYRMRACKQCQRERRRRERLQEKIMKQQKLEQALTQQRGRECVSGIIEGQFSDDGDLTNRLEWRVFRDDDGYLWLTTDDPAKDHLLYLDDDTTAPQPGAEALRELVQRWRGNVGLGDVNDPADTGFDRALTYCAYELESLLARGG